MSRKNPVGFFELIHVGVSVPAKMERIDNHAGRGLWSKGLPDFETEWAPMHTASPEPKPEPKPQRGRSRRYNPNGPDRNCSDFSSHAAAQAFFEVSGPSDPHRLDGDNNGVACESL